MRNEATRNDEYPPAPGSALVGWGDLSDCVCGMDSLVLSRFARRDVLVGIGRRVISGSLGVRAEAAERQRSVSERSDVNWSALLALRLEER